MKTKLYFSLICLILCTHLYAQESNISFVGEWISGHCLAVRAEGDLVYFNQGRVFRIMDVSVPDEPHMVGSFKLEHYPSNIWNLKIVDHFAYIQDELNLYLLDIEDPNAIKKSSMYELDCGSPVQFFVKGKYVYILFEEYYQDDRGWQSWFEIVDYSNALNPIRIGKSKDFSGRFSNLVVSENLVYISNRNGTLRSFDINDPVNPVESEIFYTKTIYEEFDIADTLLYMIDHSGELNIYNLSDPSQLIKLNSFQFAEDDFFPHTLKVENKFSYILNWDGQLIIIDRLLTFVKKHLCALISLQYCQDYLKAH